MIGKLLRRRYKITDLLGGGGSGETYIAVDLDRLNARCVVKRLKLPHNDPKALDKVRQMFSQEAETLEALGREHHQIPTLLAYFEEEEEFYLVQDFIEGQPLHVELPAGHRWSEAKVVQLLHDVLQILEFIHHKGVIHRDLKPANLIRQQQDGKLVLIDFGAVKQMQHDPVGPAPINPTTIAIGTEGYMPTEQMRGKPRPNSDIYALGIIGIQAITGINPGHLQEDRDGEVIWRSYVPEINEDLAAILTKMVRYHFKDRHQTATEVLQEIQPLHDHYFGRSTPQQGSLSSTTDRANSAAPAASQIQPQAGSNAVDLPETKFTFHQDSPQNDQSDQVLDGNQSKKLSIEPASRRFTLNRIRAIAFLGLVIGAIVIPTGIWLSRPKPIANPDPSTPEWTGEVSPTGEEAPINSNGLKGDYRKLQGYLQKKDWKNADEETYQIMLKVAGPISEQQGYFSNQEWNKFSCSDLKEIDRLWSKASGGRLGFSAQNKVLSTSENDPIAFLKKVRWVMNTPKGSALSWLVIPTYSKKNRRVEYEPGKSPDFTKADSIEGYLPAKLLWEGGDYRFQRSKNCGL